MTKIIFFLVITLFSSQASRAQDSGFKLSIEPLEINGQVGLQSFAFGVHNGKWLLVGGRLDGLHQRQPFAAFRESGNNKQLIVIDPVTTQKWTADLSTLPLPIQEQLSSSNMQFYQTGSYLYCIGGYGFSGTINNHTTYNKLTAINLPEVIDAIIAKKGFAPFFRQISDSLFQVTGGKLQKVNNSFYLIGGQKFIGRYNPMGPKHGPGFVQEYTNAIRKFNLLDDGEKISIIHLPSFIDAVHLHRRDYNALPQILPNGEEGITIFSGVFQQNAELPFLHAVNIDSTNYKPISGFRQYYNHYHSATLPIYSAARKQMNNVFFGGIAQYYNEAGIVVQDNNVPFVNTIARVTRDVNGKMAEYKLPVSMPSLLGAGSEFIINDKIPKFANGVIKLDEITNENTLLGYIVVGISSRKANIFFKNSGTQSTASGQVFKVYLSKTVNASLDELNQQSIGTLNIEVDPNVNEQTLNISFNLTQASLVKVTIFKFNGKKISEKKLDKLRAGENNCSLKFKNLGNDNAVILKVKTEFEEATQKIILR